MLILELFESASQSDGVALSGDVVQRIFSTENRAYWIYAPTMQVYSFATFEHSGHLRSKDVSDDPFLRDYEYYGSFPMAIRHHLIRVVAYEHDERTLSLSGQGPDLAKSFSLWLPAARHASLVTLNVYDAGGIPQQFARFEMPIQRGDLARFMKSLRSGDNHSQADRP